MPITGVQRQLRGRRRFETLFWEAIIFAFPVYSEIIAFAAAYSIRYSNVPGGTQLLILLAAVKLAGSILEYKGFEEVYLDFGKDSSLLYLVIGLVQLAQGFSLPLIILLCSSLVLSNAIPALLIALLLWVGTVTSMRQFLSYRWRSELRKDRSMPWRTTTEIILGYFWLGIVSCTVFFSRFAPSWSSRVLVCAWLLSLFVALVYGVWSLKRHHISFGAILTWHRWMASIGQATASQLGKEFFLIASTTNVEAGFIARVAVTLYGLGVSFPVSVLRVRVFDRFARTNSGWGTMAKAMDAALRKRSFLISALLLVCACFGNLAVRVTSKSFPFTSAFVGQAIACPMAAFDASSYFALLTKGLRTKCFHALVVGGLVVLVMGFALARIPMGAGARAFSVVLVLGIGDFIINRMSKIFAMRAHA